MDKNIPNYLTLARIFIIPIIIFSLYFVDSVFAHRFASLLFFLASITDFIDGYLARRFNLTSRFGRIFDPIADKLLVVCVIVMLVKYHAASEIPCIMILAREFIVAGLREFLAQIHLSVPVTRLAKVKTFTQMSALILLILGSKGSGIVSLDIIAKILLWLSAILTLVTGVNYLKISSKYF